MSSSVEQKIHSAAVFFAACSSVVDVSIVKGPAQNQLEVSLFEPTIGAHLPTLFLDYAAIVKRLGKNAEQSQLNVVLDSSSAQCTELEPLRTLIRNKAIFDFVISGLFVVYDAEEMRILRVDSEFASKLSISPEISDPRSLSGAAQQVSSLVGKALTVSGGEAVADSSSETTGKTMTSSVTPDSTNTTTSNDTKAGTQRAEPNKYTDASSSPARRLARFLLARVNTPSCQLTDSNLTLSTEAAGSDRIDSPLTCTSLDPQQPEPQEMSVSCTTADMSARIDHTKTCTRFHPAMQKPVFAKHLTVDTDLSIVCDYDDDFGDLCDGDEGESSGEEGGDGKSGRQECTHGLLAKLMGGTCACTNENSSASIKASEAPAGTNTYCTNATKGAKQKPAAVAARSPSSVSWWLNALVSRLSTKQSAVHVE